MEGNRKFFKGCVPPPIIFCCLVLLGFITRWIYPVDFIFSSWVLCILIGLPMITLAGLIALSSMIIMKKKKTAIVLTKPTTTFITTGVFKFTPNPLYLSLLLAMTSIVFFANSAWHFLLLIALFFVFNFGIVTKEENYLEDKYGEQYRQYKKRIRRWI